MSHILVTGGAGFIGAHLCRKLLEEKYHVICLDNLYTGREQNIAELKEKADFEFLLHDVIDPIDVQCDLIINLACPASPPHYQRDALFTTKTSVIGTLNLLELAKKNDCPLLHASTSEVYGDPSIHPQPESYWGNVNPIGPRSCYDEGKRMAETLCMDFHRQHQLDVRIFRIFNTYGPYMDPQDGRVVSNFITQALQNQPITIYGDGSQTRSFQYVSDLVEGILKLMDTKNFTGPVNLGNPDEFTILELAEKITQITQSKSDITHLPLPQDDPKQRQPDIELAKKELNWTPNVSLQEGLEKTIPYFRNEIAS